VFHTLPGSEDPPSRSVEQGATHWAEVLLIEFDNQGEAVRAALEQFGLRVTLVRIGQARHLVAALSDIGAARYVVLDCHGEDGNIFIPELAPELEAQQPFHQRMTPEDVTTFARLDGALVISTGCTTATPAMGQAVLGRGALGYLAPVGYPDGGAAFFAITYLFYELSQGRDIRQAFNRLREHDLELAMWRLHTEPSERAWSR
jgi:hypothetical protein